MLVNEDNFEDCLTTLKTFSTLSVDLETTGLGLSDVLCGIAVGYGESFYYFPFRHGEGENLPIQYLNPLKALLLTRTCFFWNAKFDLKMLYKDNFPQPTKIEDIMLAAHLLNENETTYTLKGLGAKYIGGEAKEEQKILEEELASKGYGKGSMWKLSAKLVAPYAVQDVRLTFQLREFYLEYLKKYELSDLYEELSEYLKPILSMELRGIKLDTDLVHKLNELNLQTKEDCLKTLSTMAGYELNPNSPKQVQAFLGIAGSTAVEILEKLEHPGVAPILQFRRCTKVNGSYYTAFLENMDNEAILHPNLFMVGTVTGRFSCSKPNLQAIPRQVGSEDPRSKVKEVFVAREGYSFVQMDYRQAEVYLGAHYAKATSLLKMIEEGEDIHQATADSVGIPRYAAKRMNFAMQYGISPKGLAGDLGVSIKEAKGYLEAYHEVHPEMVELYYSLERVAKNRSYIRLFTGRMRRYGNNLPRYSPHRKASSNLIQGGVAELMRIASTKVYTHLKDYAHQLLHIHDSILYEVKDKDLNWVIPALEELMTDFDEYNFRVSFKVDTSVGKRWSELL